MTTTTDMPSNVRREIDDYLEEVEAVLQQSDVSRSERRTLCDELDCQIMDMLAQRYPDAPSVGDAKALLAEMDPPSRFARHDTSTQLEQTSAPSFLALSIGAAVTAILGIIGAFLWAEWRGAESDRQQAAVIAFLITLLALAMGVTAIRGIRRNPRTNRGYLLAYIGVISLPMCFCLWANREISLPINTQLSREVADYVRSQRVIARTQEREIKIREGSNQPQEGEVILSPKSETLAELPFVPWITTKRGVRLFSIATCFGPTALLTLIFVPLFYKRFHPRLIRA